MIFQLHITFCWIVVGRKHRPKSRRHHPEMSHPRNQRSFPKKVKQALLCTDLLPIPPPPTHTFPPQTVPSSVWAPFCLGLQVVVSECYPAPRRRCLVHHLHRRTSDFIKWSLGTYAETASERITGNVRIMCSRALGHLGESPCTHDHRYYLNVVQ